MGRVCCARQPGTLELKIYRHEHDLSTCVSFARSTGLSRGEAHCGGCGRGLACHQYSEDFTRRRVPVSQPQHRTHPLSSTVRSGGQGISRQLEDTHHAVAPQILRVGDLAPSPTPFTAHPTGVSGVSRQKILVEPLWRLNFCLSGLRPSLQAFDRSKAPLLCGHYACPETLADNACP